MKMTKRMRVSMLAVVALLVGGVVAVVACAPSAVPEQSGAGSEVPESVSVPVTEAPFVLPQSGDGDGTGGQGEPTAEPTAEPTKVPTEEPTPTQYVPPTANPSHCKVSGDNYRRCPPDGDPKVEYQVRQHYNYAMRQNEAIGLRGDARVFPDLEVRIRAKTADDVDGVVEFLRDNGVRLNQWSTSVNQDTDFGMVSVSMNLSLLPELVALDGVKLVKENVGGSDITPGQGFAWSAVDQELWDLRGSFILANRDRRGRGEEELSYPVVRVLIEVGALSAVGEVVRYLDTNDAKKIAWRTVEPSEEDVDGSGTVEADISLGLLSGLKWFPGVERVSKAKTTSRRSTDGGEPSSGRNEGRGVVGLPPRSATPVPVASSATVTLQADQWHRAGFTGAGVEVAIIDSGFMDFREDVLPLLSQPVHFLCYHGIDHAVAEGILYPDETEIDLDGDVTSDFIGACDAVSSMHGTAVAASLVEIAPDVKLYLSNVDEDGDRRLRVINWLTTGVGFDVDVINHSRGFKWDGPGDGSSPFSAGPERSSLYDADDATNAGILWVNASGNHGDVTWFSYHPTFTSGSPRLLDFDNRPSVDTCNEIDMQAAFYSFQLRWSGDWLGEDTDLDVVLYPSSGSASNPLGENDGVTGGQVVQHGGDGPEGEATHYPLERLNVASGRLTGEHCLSVVLNSGAGSESSSGSRSVTEPPGVVSSTVEGLDWVQLQMFKGPATAELPNNTAMGSLTNPAESTNPGMLSVGFTDPAGETVDGRSGRGPAPGLRYVRVLDLVSDGTHPFRPGSRHLRGSSGSAPRVAGLSSLVTQALGDREEYDTPAEVAQYMRDFGSTGIDCFHDRGCGFAMLGPLDPPTNPRLESTSNACGVVFGFRHNVRLTFDAPTSGNPDVPESYSVELRKVGDTDADPLARGGVIDDETATARLLGGETYAAEVRTCVPGVTGEPVCGAASVSSNELSVPREVCRSVHFDVIPGNGIMTLRWDAQPDATEYDVQRVEEVGGEWVPVSGAGATLTDQHWVDRGLADGVVYSYRLRSRSPSGDSEWSEVLSNHTGNALPFVSSITGFQEYPTRNQLGQYDAVFGWLYGASARYDVQVREAGTGTWVTLSSDPDVAGEGPRVIFNRDPYVGGNFGSSNMYGALTGLMPGTEYEIQVRGVNGDLESPWAEALTFTTLGRRPFDSTTRPPKPDGLRVDASSVQPSPRVVLGWDASVGDYLHEVRVMGGGIDTWHRLPQQPSGWSSEYLVRYPTGGQAFITGLIPGTEYHFAVRAAKERNSRDNLDHSPWSEVVTVTMPGVRPSDAPGSATAPALKAPPEDLMAVVNGTTVELTWTATTNPNYTSQRLLRRVAGVSPIQWTEIPLADVNVTTYTDTGLTSGVTYRYRVRAYKDGGNYGEEQDGHADAVIP